MSAFEQCESVFEKAEEIFGITEDTENGAWILPDGRMLNFKKPEFRNKYYDNFDETEYKYYEHETIIRAFKAIGINFSGYDTAREIFKCDCGAIRFYRWNPTVYGNKNPSDKWETSVELDTCVKPTAAQWKTLLKAVEDSAPETSITYDLYTLHHLDSEEPEDYRGPISAKLPSVFSAKQNIGKLRLLFEKYYELDNPS